jgi:hypothetical protein
MLEGSPSSVLTLGLGSWGSSSLAITSGFGVGEAATVVAVRPVLTWETINRPLYFQVDARQPHYEVESNNLPLWSDE